MTDILRLQTLRYALHTDANTFTGTPGKFVKREDTVRSFKEILEGKHDGLPESAFYMVGSIEEAVARGAK